MPKFENSNPVNMSLFNQSISYLQSFPAAREAVSAFIMSNEVTVNFSYDGHMSYDSKDKIINFDPTAAMQVIQPNGMLGAQSPALGLFHEIIHWYLNHVKGMDHGIAEHFATLYEADVARQADEPIRESYYHVSAFNSGVTVDHPTAHAKGGYWKKVDNGQIIQGPEYDPNVTVIDTSPQPPGGGDTGGGGSGSSGGGGSVGGGGGGGTWVGTPGPVDPDQPTNPGFVASPVSEYVEIETIGLNDIAPIF